MKHILLMAILLPVTVFSFGQNTASAPAVLYGTITKTDLQTAPYNQWFTTGYESYQPNVDVITALKKINTKDITVQIFMGTWCGDSRREVPHFLKLADEIGWSDSKVKIIAVGGSDSLYKQSPGGEEIGKGIYRVPAIIIYKNGTEINRITEFPVNSLEKDLLAIITGKEYAPNYKSLAMINRWMNEGVLIDKNISTRGLAMQIKPLTGNENELNSLGYLLLKQNKKEEALRIFQVNSMLYPESSNVISSLGEGYLKTGDNKNAVLYLERALALNKDPAMLKEILPLLYEAKGVKE